MQMVVQLHNSLIFKGKVMFMFWQNTSWYWDQEMIETFSIISKKFLEIFPCYRIWSISFKISGTSRIKILHPGDSENVRGV